MTDSLPPAQLPGGWRHTFLLVTGAGWGVSPLRSSDSSTKMLEFHALDCCVLFKSLLLSVWLLVGWHFLLWSWCLVIRSAVVSCVLHIWVLLAQHNSSHTFWSNVPKLQEGQAIEIHIFVLIPRDETGKGHNPFQRCPSAWMQALILLFSALQGFFISCS